MRLTTAEKVNAGFIAALAVVGIIGIASITSIQLFLSTSADVRRTHEVLRELEGMLANLTAAESAQRGFVITGDDSYLEPYTAAHQTVARRVGYLRRASVEPEQLERLARLGNDAQLRLRLMNDLVEARREGGLEAAAQLVATGAGRRMMGRIRLAAADFERRELQRLQERQRTAEARARLTTIIIAVGGLCTFLVVFGSSVLIRRDFSERRKAAQALRDSETLLSQFMENLPIGVMVIDKQWQPRFANNAAVDILGPRVLVDTGERPLPLLSGDGAPYPEERTPVARALDGENTSTDDVFVDVDGTAIPLEVSAAPIYDASGRIAYAIIAFGDISSRRRSEEALRAARDAAETASRAKSEFLARMSHELRTPLNSVIGFANILLKNKAGNLAEQDVAYLNRILDNGKHLLLLINDILDLSKIEAGKVELEAESVDLAEVIATTVSQFEAQLGAEVRIRTTIPSALEPCHTDAARLRQVLINLVGNAVKFTEQGEVHVSVETLPDSPRPVRIRVQDTGIGIPADRLDAIFEAFEQADSTTARRFGGTGLGLPISRALCELLGFRLEVRSELGTGTEFTIEMMPSPIGIAETFRLPPPPAMARSGADRLVLIVDDEADSRILLTHYVEEFGCRAIATHSGRSAITLARELRPDLITLDLMMPDVNGWDLLAELKQEPLLADIPVVIVSIIAQESRASLLGALDLLQKPVDRNALFAVLRRNMSSDRARILLVEDEEDARELLREMLRDHTSELRTAANGREALDALSSFEPDLVITDLLMPEMDGMTFLEVFRSTPRFQHVPAVIVTAKELTAEERDRLQRHTAAVLRKGNALEVDLRRTLGSVLATMPAGELAAATTSPAASDAAAAGVAAGSTGAPGYPDTEAR
jgi:PAS domain S-box-containing protein